MYGNQILNLKFTPVPKRTFVTVSKPSNNHQDEIIDIFLIASMQLTIVLMYAIYCKNNIKWRSFHYHVKLVKCC